jgi:hypothetical protein
VMPLSSEAIQEVSFSLPSLTSIDPISVSELDVSTEARLLSDH